VRPLILAPRLRVNRYRGPVGDRHTGGGCRDRGARGNGWRHVPDAARGRGRHAFHANLDLATDYIRAVLQGDAPPDVEWAG
jgi:hypothetical protein